MTVLNNIVQTKTNLSSRELAKEILHLVFRYRRSLPNSATSNIPDESNLGLNLNLQKVEYFIEHQLPIHFILPAFPAKSPNPQKVLGTLPDMGEKISLKFLQSLCDQISEIYAHGAKLTICSDGRVFSDLVAVSDEDITAYAKGIQEILHEIKADSIDVFNLEDVLPDMSFDEMRQLIDEQYGEPLESLRARVKHDADTCQLFNGIHRFLCEDYTVLHPEKSRNKIKSECKEIAYKVVQRSNSWGSLMVEYFPHALRLSIHPQPHTAEKIGIHMIQTSDQWGTPWHNATVYDGHEYRIMKRCHIESMDAVLVYENNRPSHFVVSKPFNVSENISREETV